MNLEEEMQAKWEEKKRELEEETGLRAEEWRKLTTIYTTPGFCNEQIAIYLATGLNQSSAHPDEDEFLEIKYVKIEELYEKCLSGEILDGKTIVAVLVARAVVACVMQCAVERVKFALRKFNRREIVCRRPNMIHDFSISIKQQATQIQNDVNDRS